MTAQTSRRPSRSGGRAARTALRAAPLAKDKRPVRAGMEGGKFGALSDADIAKIHETALTALEEIGICEAPQSGIEIMTGAGAVLGDDGRIRFPRALVEDMLAVAARDITLCSRDGKHDLTLSGKRVHYGTAGAAVHMVDVHGREYRESTLQDLHDASCSGTTKHIGTSFVEPSFIPDCLEILHMIAGGEAMWRDRPFVSNSNCFVVPPMKFATESCEVMEACIRGGMPVLLLSAGQAGATAPAPIAGAIVQAVAECLAGVVYVNAMAPGHPAIFGTWPFVSDLRTGAMSGGSGEQALLTSGCAQMHQFYGLPGGAAAGIADAKLPDMQAGWEQMCSNVMAGLSGLNMVYEAAGMHASLLGFCHESLILGDDLIGQALRCVRGIEVNDETLGLETMRQTCIGGPGHYLGTDQTLALMQTEYIYPELADRTSPKEWGENGRPDLLEKTVARKEAMLAERSAARFDAQTDAAIRARFNIHLEA